MGYGAPLQNQNKGYAAQEKKDLGKMPGAFKQMSTGSLMSKHISSPLAMGKTPIAKLGDLDKDGKMSEYETKRQTAIDKNT